MSFIAIQQLQLEQIAGHSKDRRSLREIQEEESALQQEADFLVWWTAEEERIRLETEITAIPQDVRQKQTKEQGHKADQAGNRVSRGSRGRGVKGTIRRGYEAS
jgi:hypothetical protein